LSATGRPYAGFDTVANGQAIPFSFNYTLDPGQYVVGAQLHLGYKSTGSSSANDTLYLENTSRSFSYSDLGLSTPSTTARGGVVDLSKWLAALQDGKLNVAL